MEIKKPSRTAEKEAKTVGCPTEEKKTLFRGSNCDNWVKGQDNWQNRISYHCNDNAYYKNTHRVAEIGPIGRRRAGNIGAPSGQIQASTDKICFNEAAENWECEYCITLKP